MRFLILALAVSVASVVADVPLEKEYQDVAFVHVRERRQSHRQGQQQIQYQPYSRAPAQLQHIVQSLQHRDPIVHLPPQPVPKFSPATAEQQQRAVQQVAQYKPSVQYGSAPQQPTYKSIPQAAQQPVYATAAANYGQQAQQNYRPAYNPIPAQQQAQPHYSSKLPAQLQQLVQFQANIANTIPGGNAGHPQSKLLRPQQYR